MRNLAFTLLVVLTVAACGGDDAIDSDEQARRAYLGLDGSIGKSLTLGFDGYNAATSANINPQDDVGDATGTLTITGQVPQSTSDNHEMRLHVGMVDYSDGVFTVVIDGDTEVEVDLTYDTSAVEDDQPYLHLSLRNVPSGTLDGELTGVYHMTGDLDGDVTLNLTMSGDLQDAGGGVVERVPGTTTVTGTATSGGGLFTVDLTI